MKLVLAFLMLTTPAFADVVQVVDDHILPGTTAFATQAQTLSDQTAACDVEAIKPAWNATFDAWLGIAHLRFGPVESQGRAQTIAFWPDTRSATPAALRRLTADKDPIIGTPEGTAEISVAARGLFALEYLLYDPEFATTNPYTCQLIDALADDLARLAAQIDADWQDGYADLMRTAGAPGNGTYLSIREARQALFTSLMAGLEFTADQRVGRPLGSFERPRPTRAEAVRSGRSLHNVVLSLKALRNLATTLSDTPLPVTEAAFDRAIGLARDLDDPVFAGVAEPQSRLKVEILQQAIRGARTAAGAEIGPMLGVTTGFNSADGD